MRVYKARDVAVQKLGEKRVRQIERTARAELAREHLEANLRAVREMVGKTQVDLARAAGISQAELSRNEAAGDHLVSTLRRYVEALGGELEVLARFGDRTVKLHGIEDERWPSSGRTDVGLAVTEQSTRLSAGRRLKRRASRG